MTKKQLYNLLIETAVRSNLILPTTEEQMKWFEDACDYRKSDFNIRLYKALGVNKKGYMEQYTKK